MRKIHERFERAESRHIHVHTYIYHVCLYVCTYINIYIRVFIHIYLLRITSMRASSVP